MHTAKHNVPSKEQQNIRISRWCSNTYYSFRPKITDLILFRYEYVDSPVSSKKSALTLGHRKSENTSVARATRTSFFEKSWENILKLQKILKLNVHVDNTVIYKCGKFRLKIPHI
jgi:hypothetical protein